MSACKQNVSDEVVMPSIEKEIVDALVEVNKSVVKRNRNHIQNFLKRTAWEMLETDDGIWFGIVEHGMGEKVSINDERVCSTPNCSRNIFKPEKTWWSP